MCESNAYFKDKAGNESLLMKDVAKMEPLGGGKWKLETMLGDEKIVDGDVIVVDFEGHKIVIGAK